MSYALPTRDVATGTPRQTAAHATRRLFALWRLSRRQPHLRLLLGTMAGIVLAVTGLGVVEGSSAVLTAVELHSSVAPLAPAPAVPHAPRFTFAPRHHLLRNLHPLAGLASWYGAMWNGKPTASGETYDETQLTAAHPTLPLGTRVRVTDLHSMRSVIVRINDRGSLAPGRIIDLSSAAAREIGILQRGLARVSLEVLPGRR